MHTEPGTGNDSGDGRSQPQTGCRRPAGQNGNGVSVFVTQGESSLTFPVSKNWSFFIRGNFYVGCTFAGIVLLTGLIFSGVILFSHIRKLDDRISVLERAINDLIDLNAQGVGSGSGCPCPVSEEVDGNNDLRSRVVRSLPDEMEFNATNRTGKLYRDLDESEKTKCICPKGEALTEAGGKESVPSVENVGENNGAYHYGPRSVSLRPIDNSRTVRGQKQVIGKWKKVDPQEVGQFGANYNSVELTEDDMKVTIQESGLHLILVQVTYRETEIPDMYSHAAYQIWLRKNPRRLNFFQRATQVGECSLAVLTTNIYPVSCFTSLAMHLEEDDTIFLEHSTRILPDVVANRQGQTFITLVKL